jgi:glycosyltransferase involved in cell wall biosynthesis
MKKVYAVLLTHNRLEYCKTAIESFLSQTYENRKLIIINNGNPTYFRHVQDFIDFQDTDKIEHHFFLRKINTTIGELRDYGLAKCSNADYVCTWDDDDFYSKTRIESGVFWLEKTNSDMVMFSNFFVKIKDLKHKATNRNGLESSLMFKYQEGLHYPFLFKREDTVFVEELLKIGYKKYVIDNSHEDYTYNFHGQNTCDFNHFMAIIKNHTKQ